MVLIRYLGYEQVYDDIDLLMGFHPPPQYAASLGILGFLSLNFLRET